MKGWLVSEGTPTAYGGRTVRIDPYRMDLPWRCPLCDSVRHTACSSERCPANQKVRA